MFSPNVLYRLPCADKTLTTLLVKGVGLSSCVGSWAATMNCSLSTSRTRMTG